MSAQFVATQIHILLSIIGGLVATLIGFRVVNPKSWRNEKLNSMSNKWTKHLRWLGPLWIAITLLQFSVSAFSEPKQQMLEVVRASVSSEGRLANHDQSVESPDGFIVLVPEGYTYSKPPGTPFSLLAIYDVRGIASPVISVSVLPLNGSLEQLIESMKAIMVEKNKTTKFTETRRVEKGRYRLYRTSMTSQEDGNYVKGGMLFFENGGKMFMLSYGTREDLFNKHIPIFTKVIRTFGPN